MTVPLIPASLPVRTVLPRRAALWAAAVPVIGVVLSAALLTGFIAVLGAYASEESRRALLEQLPAWLLGIPLAYLLLVCAFAVWPRLMGPLALPACAAVMLIVLLAVELLHAAQQARAPFPGPSYAETVLAIAVAFGVMAGLLAWAAAAIAKQGIRRRARRSAEPTGRA